jgi:serine/threonine-protein phosphatase 2B regulatory subunit
MAATFGHPAPAPNHVIAEPQKEAPPEKALIQGLEHRPFTEEEIKQAFDTFDLDKNRFVGVAEIGHILSIIGEEATDEEIDEMIRMCDSDGDGQVTFDEFYKMMMQPPPPLPPPIPEKIQKSRKKSAYGAAERQYQRSATQGLQGVSSPGGLDEGNMTLGQPGQPPRPSQSGQPAKVSKKLEMETQNQKAQEDKKIRTQSVEGLVTKLSGGIGKIKPSQIKKVYKRFQDIDVDGSGSIDYAEFIQALGMEDNMISRRMFEVFDMDGSNSIELKEFIVVLSRYTTAAKTEKLKFAFMMFDEDGSGEIDRNELIQMLQASFVAEGYSPDELEEKADGVFDFLSLPRDGSISYEDFLRLSSSRNGLIYPIEEERHTLAKDHSINAQLGIDEEKDED